MTQVEQALADDRMRAEIAKLTAETAQIQQNMKYRFWVMAAAYITAVAAVFQIFG